MLAEPRFSMMSTDEESTTNLELLMENEHTLLHNKAMKLADSYTLLRNEE